MPQNPQRGIILSHLKGLFDEVGSVKEASIKQADKPIGEAGGYEGETSHPIKNVPNNTIKAQEGARSAENTKDIKDQPHAEGLRVDESPEVGSSLRGTKGSGNQDKVQVQIGAQHAATGEDTSTERDFKGSKDDPGTSSVMTTEDGEKYGSFQGWSYEKLASFIGPLGNEILADIGNGKLTKRAKSETSKLGDDVANNTIKVKHGEKVDETPKKPAKAQAEEGGEEGEGETEVESDEIQKAAEAGYQLAAVLGAGQDPNQVIQQFFAHTIKEAQFQADLVAEALGSYVNTRFQKKAAGEDGGAGEGEDHSMGGDAASGANDSGAITGGPGVGGDPGAGGDPMETLSQLPPEILDQLVQLVESGQLPGMEGGMGGGAGGDPTMGGGAPGGAGGDPGAGGGLDALGGGPMPGGPVQPDEAMGELGNAAIEQGTSPDELMAQGQKAASASKRAFIVKVAKQLKQHMRSGDFRIAEAKTARAKRIRGEMHDFVSEVLSY